MKEQQFKKPPKIRGQSLQPVRLKLDPEFKQAVQEFARAHSERQGIKVSMSNVLQTATMQQFKDVRDRYRQLKKEKTNARKHMDIKSTAHPIVSDPSIN